MLTDKSMRRAEIATIVIEISAIVAIVICIAAMLAPSCMALVMAAAGGLVFVALECVVCAIVGDIADSIELRRMLRASDDK